MPPNVVASVTDIASPTVGIVQTLHNKRWKIMVNAQRRHNLCISGIEKLALAGDAYANCPNGWTSDQEERSVLT